MNEATARFGAILLTIALLTGATTTSAAAQGDEERPGEASPAQTVEQRLHRPISISVEEAGLENLIHAIASEAQVRNVFLHQLSLEDAQPDEPGLISLDLQQVPAATVLTLALDSVSLHLDWAVVDDVLIVGSREYLRHRFGARAESGAIRPVLRLYDLTDLVQQKPGGLESRQVVEHVVDVARAAVMPTAEGPINIRPMGSLLAVTATAQAHARIGEVLATLRQRTEAQADQPGETPGEQTELRVYSVDQLVEQWRADAGEWEGTSEGEMVRAAMEDLQKAVKLARRLTGETFRSTISGTKLVVDTTPELHQEVEEILIKLQDAGSGSDEAGSRDAATPPAEPVQLRRSGRPGAAEDDQ